MTIIIPLYKWLSFIGYFGRFREFHTHRDTNLKVIVFVNVIIVCIKRLHAAFGTDESDLFVEVSLIQGVLIERLNYKTLIC